MRVSTWIKFAFIVGLLASIFYIVEFVQNQADRRKLQGRAP